MSSVLKAELWQYIRVNEWRDGGAWADLEQQNKTQAQSGCCFCRPGENKDAMH